MRCWGERVAIRNMVLDDVKHMCNWENGDDRIFADYNFPNMTLKEQRRWYLRKNTGMSRCFVVENCDSKIIGYIAMKKINKLLKTAELGIVMSPKEVGKGLGTEAIKVFLNWYFGEHGFNKLWLRVGAYNKRALKSYQKLGFEYKKQHYGRFYNEEINPFEDEECKDIRDYFRSNLGVLETLYYTLETSKRA